MVYEKEATGPWEVSDEIPGSYFYRASSIIRCVISRKFPGVEVCLFLFCFLMSAYKSMFVQNAVI